MSTTEHHRQQRRLALERANEIRMARAELKRRIVRGDVFPASILLDPPAPARNWEVGKFVSAQPRWGPERTRKLLARLRIAESKPLERLTQRQRQMLAKTLSKEVEK